MSDNDPWAAAQASTATATQDAPQSSSDLYPSQGEESQLFSGGSVAPSLFNKLHPLGTERTGIITKAPYDRQKVDYTSKRPLFWDEQERKPYDQPVNRVTGKPNRAVMDTFLELSTDYTMDAAEAAAVGREAPYEGNERVFVAGGRDLKKLRAAIEDANKRGIRITSGADMVGKRLRVKRVGQIPNPTGNPSWDLAIRIDNA